MEIRRAGPNDTTAICELLASTNPANPKSDPDVLRWQYWENPFGNALSFVSEDDGRIVCHMARVPVPMLVDARGVRGAVTVDAATLETHRARGLYSTLRDLANEESNHDGIVATLDFRASGRELPRGSARFVAAFSRHVIPLDVRWLASRMRLPVVLTKPLVRAMGVGRGPSGHAVEGTPGDIDALWREVAPRVRYGVQKEGAWWRWRYDARPHSPYRYFVVREGGELAAAAVARNREDVLAILDLLARSPEAARAVVRTMAAEAAGAGALAFLAPPGTFWSQLARQAGFRALPRWADRRQPTLHVRDLSRGCPELVDARWEATWGDMDHV